MEEEKEAKILVPPLNFAMVAPGVYRSGHPNPKNFEFLKKLKLKTIMYLAPEDYTLEQSKFNSDMNLKVYQYLIKGNKEPFGDIDQNDISQALVHVLDRRNHPILIHCNKGKYRIGCLIACLRKLQNWSLASIFDEFTRFAGTKIRIADQEFIEIYNMRVEYDVKYLPFWFNK
ncbi:protein-tyrosine phosphatase [Neoconidiobolus thromboides FSU 785]|nr:protein-tyrosine phosphatase [Neoconidiobolus thromboides FSU 785]